MSTNRTKNASRNIAFGIILKAFQIFIPFLMRTVMIHYMGVEYLGLNSLFTSVLQVLSLAEMGVASAMVYSMYKPIAENDEITLSALVNLYRKYYRIIGGFIAFIGILVTPFIPYLIKKDLPNDVNVYVLYLLNLAATVMSYWLFAYKNSLLHAFQRSDVYSKIALITSTIQYLLQLIAIVVLKNYYWFVVAILIAQILTNILLAIITDKLYPQYPPKGELDKQKRKEINRRIKDLFTSKVGNVVVGSCDTVVISAFLGLTTLAIYQNYYYIMISVCGFIAVIFNAVTAGIGNSLVVETKEKNFKDFNTFTFIISWIVCVCCNMFVGLYQPFMKIWVGEKYLLPFGYVILICIYFYLYQLSMLWTTIKDAAGIWHADRYRPLISACVNLGLNIILAKYYGLYGVIVSTILSFICVSLPWLIHNIFSLLYKNESIHKYLFVVCKYTFVTVFTCSISIFMFGNSYSCTIGQLIIRFICCFIISNFIQLLFFGSSEEFKKTKIIIINIIKK